MGYLENKTVYLAGSMLSADDDGVGWRNFIRPQLEDFGLNILDPTRKTTEGCSEVADDKEKFKALAMTGDYKKLQEEFEPVARWDLRSVDKSDFLIVGYDFTIPTFGTIDEITVAAMQRKPILFHFAKSQLNRFNPWTTVRVQPEHIFNQWAAVMEHLTEVDNGNYNKKYWTL